MPHLGAKDLDLIDVGGLEADHRADRHTDDGSEILPMETADRNDVTEIDGAADEAQQHEIRNPDEAGEHDRGIGAVDLLIGDGQRGWRQASPAFNRRLAGDGDGGGGGRSIQHRSSVDRFHNGTSPDYVC